MAKTALFVSGILISLLFILSVTLIVISPKPENIRATDISARSFFVSWVTKKPSTGCAIAQFGKYKVKKCQKEKNKTHLVMIDGLAPENTYELTITSNFRKIKKGLPIVTTGKIQEQQPKTPEPAYGSVKWKDTSQPIKNALIYFRNPTLDKKEVFATLTNEKGNYAIDLSNFENLEKTILIEVVIDPKTRTLNELDITKHSPFPTLLIPGP
jgi:hypothetical protein